MDKKDLASLSERVTKRLHQLEEIISGERDSLTSAGCGLCAVMHRINYLRVKPKCFECPFDFCFDNGSGYRRIELFEQKNQTELAKRHHTFLLKLLKKNGWEYVYETK